jgi:hypothetical protein
MWRCFECGLVDPYDGEGDGIGSCECPRCEDCGAPPGACNGHDEDERDHEDPYARQCCGDPNCACHPVVPSVVTVEATGGVL